MRESAIHLPMNDAGVPDFAYMEAFIEALPFSGQIDGKPELHVS